MKKFVLTLLTALMAVCYCDAQTSLVATLNHEGNITAYYGINALSEAHATAVNGDIITLSSGTFTACDITKAVTIRGAGMEYSDGMEPTILNNHFSVNISKDIDNVFVIEGIYHTGDLRLLEANKPLFYKCRFYTINTYKNGLNGNVSNANFIHCKVANLFYLHTGNTVSFDNCLVNNPIYHAEYSVTNYAHFYFTNCVLWISEKTYQYGNQYNNAYGGATNINFSSLKNCIVYSKKTDDYFNESTTLYNNVANINIFTNCPNTTNLVEADFTKLFKTWTGDGYSDTEKYDLTNTAATTYVGDNGKQVGIYGGSLPYDPIPTHPKITKLNVASKTTADGKLSVDIEVKAADY